MTEARCWSPGCRLFLQTFSILCTSLITEQGACNHWSWIYNFQASSGDFKQIKFSCLWQVSRHRSPDILSLGMPQMSISEYLTYPGSWRYLCAIFMALEATVCLALPGLVIRSLWMGLWIPFSLRCLNISYCDRLQNCQNFSTASSWELLV